MANRASGIAQAYESLDREQAYTVDQAVKMIKERAKAKFDETVEIAMNLGIDPRHADQSVRGAVNLPNGTGKSLRVAVFAKGDKAEEAEKAGRRHRRRRGPGREGAGGRDQFRPRASPRRT